MNTLIVAEQLRRRVPGGIGTYIDGLLKGLADSGEYVGLWASKRVTPTEPLSKYNLPVYASRMPSKVMTRAWDRGWGGMPGGWDLVHATSTLVPPKRKVPMTATVHDLAWREFPDAYPERGRHWHEASLHRTIKRCEALITPSRQTATALLDAGVDNDRIKVIPLGVDHLPEPDRRGALKKLNKAGVFGDFLLAVGTLEPRKNLGTLVSAFNRARASLPDDMSLVLVGPQGWGDQLVPSQNVQIISSATMAEITALYDRCTAFVSVPLVEGFGLPVLEAMSRGAAVVASSVPSAGTAAYLVDPTNMPAIAEGITRVVNDDNLRQELQAKGRDHAAGYTWTKCAAMHVEIWDELV
jgi:glycosyltransferase involved in cell wall biosynthesis